MTGITPIKAIQKAINSLSFDIPNGTVNVAVENNSPKCRAIRSFLNSEFFFLTQLKLLLKDIFSILIKKKQYMNNSEIVRLFEYLPSIYKVHFSLYHLLVDRRNIVDNFGQVLLTFLQQPETLSLYKHYIENVSTYLIIAASVKSKKNPVLLNIPTIVILPIQKFPQFKMAVGDIYKQTENTHPDKVFLFQALCITKSIGLQLDYHRGYSEISSFTEFIDKLKKNKISFHSQRLMSKHCVNYLETTFRIPRTFSKVPFYIILCDREVIIYKRTEQDEIGAAAEVYPIESVEYETKNVISLRGKDKLNEMERVKEMHSTLNESVQNFQLIQLVDKLVNDLDRLEKIHNIGIQLNYGYKGFDLIKIEKSLIQLDQQIYENERKLNNLLDCILTLTLKRPNVTYAGTAMKDVRQFLFDFGSVSNNWKLKFYRTKLLLDKNVITGWGFSSSEQQNVKPLESDDQPMLFPPYFPHKNGIVDITCSITKTKIVSIILRSQVLRCLWLCMANHKIVLLHLNDHSRWNILESFETDFAGSVCSIAAVSWKDISVTNVCYDIEIWMASGRGIHVYSLMDDQRNLQKELLLFQSNVNALCYVRGKMLVGLSSNEILVYTITTRLHWVPDSPICLTDFVNVVDGPVKDLRYADTKAVYAIFTETVVILNYNNDNTFTALRTVSFGKAIVDVNITNEGIWMLFHGKNEILRYDEELHNMLQKIEIPNQFANLRPVGALTRIAESEKFLWIGSENGYIILLSTADVLYFHGNQVPLYFCRLTLSGPVTDLLLFQNIQESNVKMTTFSTDSRSSQIKKSFSFTRRPTMLSDRRSTSLLQLASDGAEGYQEKTDGDTMPFASPAFTDLVQIALPKLMLVLGTGLHQCLDKESPSTLTSSTDCSEKDNPVLLTFVE